MEYLSIGIGGIGLFLWGMWLITEGLRQAAGSSLDRILTSWTSSRLKGLLAGTLLTAAVQSSSVVTMAIIGFANAGLITFQRAVWMMFGSNPGTTATAWIVALVGFKFQIDALALPIIGLGALWRVLGRTERGKSMGEAISGLGLLLLGIEVLSTGFSSLGDEVQLGQEYGVLVMVLVGIVLASIVMSSAVPVALVLTALASGSISMVDAAAVVIGANMGTSFKSILVVIGATSNARRLAAAHVFFNVFTGIVCIILLHPLLLLMYWIGGLFGVADEPVTLMAIFHTIFNVGGVILMWPLERHMSRFLMSRFKDPQRERVSLQYLDESVITVPNTIPMAMAQEYVPMLQAIPAALKQLSTRVQPATDWQDEDIVREQKVIAVGEFLVQAVRSAVTDDVAAELANGWGIYHNLLLMEEDFRDLVVLMQHWSPEEEAAQILGKWYKKLARHLIEIWNSEAEASTTGWQESYEAVKRQLMQRAMSGSMSREELDQALQSCSVSRRLGEQWLRTFLLWQKLSERKEEEIIEELAQEAIEAE